MLKNAHFQGSGGHTVDQRNHVRVQVKSVIYIELDGENGGLITNISEGGVAIQCAEPIAGELFSQMRFRFPRSESWIETRGTLVWLGKSGKEAGIQFLDLKADARQQIQNWVNQAAFGPGANAEQGGFPAFFEPEGAQPAAEANTVSESAEIDAMFPSEKSLASPASSSVSRRPPTKETDSSLDFGSPPAAAKRPLPAGRFTTEFEPPPLAHATVRNRDSWQEHSYPAANSSIASDPPASVFAEAPKAEAPKTKESRPESKPLDKASVAPAFPVRTDYRRLSYDPPPFEEPSGKGWLFAGSILAAVLVVGAVMAMGPANVRALAARYVTSVSHYISSGSSAPSRSDTSVSNSAPPPPASASEKSTTPANGADSGSSTNNSTSAANSQPPTAEKSPQPPVPNAGNTSPETNPPRQTNPQEASDAAKHGDESEAQRAIPTERNAALARPAPQPRTEAKRQDPVYQPPDASELTRQFQMEHSRLNSANTASNVSPVPPAPPATSARPESFTRNDNERTLDAYPDPAPRTSASASAAPSYVSPAPSQAPAAQSGTVAISSRFYSLRGEDPQETLSNPTLVIGQLLSIRQPVYPAEALRARVEGTVRVRATVDQTGRVAIVQAISGPPMLIASAVEAVREWHYAQTFADGHAVEGLEDVSVDFRLANAASSPR